VRTTGTAVAPGLAVHLARRGRVLRRRYRKRLEACQEKFSERAVHALRIDTRRLLALLDLLDTLGGRGQVNKLRKTFKRRLDIFDELRDTQVHRRLLKPLKGDHLGARRVLKLLRRDEARLISRLRDSTRSLSCGRLNRRLKKLESVLGQAGGRARPTPEAREGAARALREAFDRVRLLRKRVRSNNTATIHRMRVAFKQFRYRCELLLPVCPWLPAERLEEMRDFQMAAGEIQDLEILLARLARLAREMRIEPAATQTLRSELSRRRRQAIASFLARVDDLDRFRPDPPAAGGS
jgi:CHAD domain-containing protein